MRRLAVFVVALLLAGCGSSTPVATAPLIPTIGPASFPVAAPSSTANQPRTAIPSASQLETVPPPSPTATPTTPTVTADPGAPFGSRDNPYPLGAQFAAGEWTVTIDSVDVDAWPEIRRENQFNDPPPTGRRFVMFYVTATYGGPDSADASFDLSWTVVGSQGNTFGSSFDDYCGVIPDDLDEAGEVFSGATATGNVCVSVASDQIDGAVVQVEQGFLGEPVYAALE